MSEPSRDRRHSRRTVVVVRFPDGTEASFTASGPWKSNTPGLGEFLELHFEIEQDLRCHGGLDNPRRGIVPKLERDFGAVVVLKRTMEGEDGAVY